MIDIVSRGEPSARNGDREESQPVPGESWASSPTARATMLANRSRDTKPELAIRRILHSSGLRYRTHFAPLAEHRRYRADLVFTRRRIAVYIDGCFWHGCPIHHSAPRANAGYWSEKIEQNRRRDARVTELLQAAGWTVIRIWEHEDAIDAANRVLEAVRGGPVQH